MRKLPYPHPGEILLEEFLKPMGISHYRLAKEIGVSQRRIGEIVAGRGTACQRFATATPTCAKRNGPRVSGWCVRLLEVRRELNVTVKKKPRIPIGTPEPYTPSK